MEQTINNLIKQTKEEIERNRREHNKVDRASCFTERCLLCEERERLQSRLSALQTAKDIFIKMLDEDLRFLEKLDKVWAEQGKTEDNLLLDRMHSMICSRHKSIKQKLGDKTE